MADHFSSPREGRPIMTSSTDRVSDLIEEAIVDYWGERCSDFNPDCRTCEAWADFDRLRASSASGEPVAWQFVQKAYDLINSGEPPYSERECKVSMALSRALGALSTLELSPGVEITEEMVERALQAYHGDGAPPFDDYQRDAMRAVLTTRTPGAEDGKLVTDEMRAARDVLAERRRQVEVEGWTPEHDDEHQHGELARAAACYARPDDVSYTDNYGRALGPDGNAVPMPVFDLRRYSYQRALRWPWERKWWKPADTRRNLVKAGALIIAEIERLDRAALTAALSSDNPDTNPGETA